MDLNNNLNNQSNICRNNHIPKAQKVTLTYISPCTKKLVEYAGRTCYHTNEDKKTTTEQFITNIVRSGHESVIEHSNLVFYVNKTENTEKELLEIATLNNLLHIIPYDNHYYIQGNIRMYKDLIRKSFNANYYNNIILNKIRYTVLYELGDEFVVDLTYIKDKNLNLIEMDLNDNLEINKYNDKIKLLNIDYSGYSDEIYKLLTTATFEIKMHRSCSHQEVRHRMSAYSQESQRYVDMSDLFEYFIPSSIDGDKSYKVMMKDAKGEYVRYITYNEFMEMSHNFYKALKEDAREVLPNASMSTIVITRTLDEWVKYFNTRITKHAQKPIRELAMGMLFALQDNNVLLEYDVSDDGLIKSI